MLKLDPCCNDDTPHFELWGRSYAPPPHGFLSPSPAPAAIPASAVVDPCHIQWETEVKVFSLLTLKSEAHGEAFQ